MQCHAIVLDETVRHVDRGKNGPTLVPQGLFPKRACSKPKTIPTEEQ